MRLVPYEDVVNAVTVGDLFDAVRDSLRLYSRRQVSVAAVGILELDDGGDVHVKSAAMSHYLYFVVKVAASLPNAAELGRPTANGAVLVFSARSGELVASLADRGRLTDLRTAAAGAIATDLLAVAGPLTVGIVGTGVQARLQAEALAALRPITRLRLWGRRQDAARALASELAAALPGALVESVSSLQGVVEESQAVITATSSHEPLIRGRWLHPGQHLTALGADDYSKAELDDACFARADLIVVDSRDQNQTLGELGRLVQAGRPAAVAAELGDVLDGRHPGRSNPSQITVAKLTGIGVQDLAAAQVLLQRLGPLVDGSPPSTD